MLIGDYIAVNFIDRVFADPMRYTGFENLMAMYGYSLQVYADFSGYTDIAIGVALLMGFTLPMNFNSPYKAASTAEFWKRWHMSLSTWLRDYLYIPMGGNRGGSLFSWIMLGIIGLALVLLTGWIWLPVVFLSVFALFAVLTRLFPALEQPGHHQLEPDDHHVDRRSMARCQLDVRDLGRIERPGTGGLQVLETHQSVGKEHQLVRTCVGDRDHLHLHHLHAHLVPRRHRLETPNKMLHQIDQ